ncbi:MAG: hypothetical protein MUF34_18605 [Polyangiaceae bacterium]|jgi:hypothetical protein|nr:hypothetical protein [Polyangiaceae bacterium]
MTRATSQRGEGNLHHTSLVGDTLCGKNKNRYLATFLRERVVAYTRAEPPLRGGRADRANAGFTSMPSRTAT